MTFECAHQPVPEQSGVAQAQFVGRQRELDLIWRQYAIVRTGRLRVVLLSGDIGIGKTSLLREVARRMAQEEITVLQGEATDAEGMPPYLPFLEALGQYIRAAPLDILREQIAAGLQPLVSILPELAARLGTFPEEVYPFPAEQKRLRIYEAIAALLGAISTSNALVLTLDDLHWADSASLDLLCYIARRQSQAKLLIIGAYQDGALEHNRALEQAVTRLSYRRILTTITVDPLSSKEIDTLASGYLGGSLAENASALLYKQSEGNPFFAEEIMRSWIEAGHFVYENQQWVAHASLERVLPQSIIGSLRQRFMRLSREIIDDLRIASVIGHTFDLSLLAAVEGQEFESVEERLQLAERSKLVKSNQQSIFTFNHSKIREVLYDEVSASRRRRLHETIGRVLEIRYGQEGTKSAYRLAELTFHFIHSNDRERGALYAQLAAEKALQSSALEEAIAYYRTALELLSPRDEKRDKLLLALGEATLLAGQGNEAEIAFQAVLDRYMQNGDREAITQVARGLGHAQWRQGKLDAARLTFELALKSAGEALSVNAVRIRIDLAILLIASVGSQSKGMLCAQRALEMARSLGSKSLEARAIRAMVGNVHIQANTLVDAVQGLKQAQELIEEEGNFSERAENYYYLSCGYYWMAELGKAQEACLHMIELAKQAGDPYRLRNAYCLQGLFLASQGRWVEAEQAAEQLQLTISDLSGSFNPVFVYQLRGFLAYLQEDFTAAEHEFHKSGVKQIDEPVELMCSKGWIGVVQANEGKRKSASIVMIELERVLDTLQAGALLTAPLLLCQALIVLKLGDQERMKTIYRALLGFQGQCYWFLVDRVLGMVAARIGEWQMARAHLNAAEALARREEMLPELAYTLLEMAELELMRLQGGNVAHARHYLKQALPIFEKLNIAEMSTRISDRIVGMITEASRGETLALPANLTQREAEVLRLVASGKSNRQIACDLRLSERTVANHLSHIFHKTGSENRVEATTFAMNHGLI
ncbi:helix-turn-helix transcriptional regulator [Ktedonosporobacter rubrisoli]|uniref:Helix-turn-helix transcriptional regulator n=1 Tax=Ktedonosporobacter rubrisoli TaxID=2509675 RepID=A0A4V0Z0H7_KTERU|nr:AAA family ATPase [Ktedonosporobacter rubrisoli]QBD83261.1 helix-turn-helix transcriptional regulator [Ktedonosporobacter rubrisoli]